MLEATRLAREYVASLDLIGMSLSSPSHEAAVRMGQVRGQIRAVTHLDVGDEDIELALRAAADIDSACDAGRGRSS